MAHKKVATPVKFNCWQDVDDALKNLIECENQIDELTADLNRQISIAKEAVDEKAKPINEQIKKLEYDIKDFVTAHRDEIDGKTKVLNFGSTGFRQSTQLVVPSAKTADIIANLKRFKMVDCINIKLSVNKEVLKKYKTEEILRTGAYQKTIDDFWYETKKESLQSTES